MSDRPTPRTDAAVFISRGMGIVPTLPKEAVRADFARQLERELAEARENQAAMSRIAAACQCPSKDAEIAILRNDEQRLAAFSKRDRKRADDLSDKLAQVVCERDKAHAENLEQARLLGMSAERESDLRGELEREKRRADGLGYELAATREQRDEALDLLRRIARKSAFMDREGLRLVVADWLARRHLSENVIISRGEDGPRTKL